MQREILSRAFNHFKISNDSKTITKTSKNNHKLVNEINWFLNLPKSFLKYIPKIHDYSLDSNSAFLAMEFISNLNSFDQIYLNQKLSDQEVESFFKAINNFLDDASKITFNDTNTKKYLNDVYLNKTLDRLLDLQKQPKFQCYFANDFYVNDQKYRSLNHVMNILPTILEKNDLLTDQKFCLIHGDLCFNNIFFKNELKLIDPRGSFGFNGVFGDQRYEYAKIKHSISGYDQIINNAYDLLVTNDGRIKFTFHQVPNDTKFKEHFNSLITKKFDSKTRFQIDLIEALLFLSMIPLHSENFDHQILMLALASKKLQTFLK